MAGYFDSAHHGLSDLSVIRTETTITARSTRKKDALLINRVGSLPLHGLKPGRQELTPSIYFGSLVLQGPVTPP